MILANNQSPPGASRSDGFRIRTLRAAISHDTQGQSLHLGHRFRLCLTVSHYSGEIRNLGQPAAILFSLNFELGGTIGVAGFKARITHGADLIFDRMNKMNRIICRGFFESCKSCESCLTM
jgi:hypothetical protein